MEITRECHGQPWGFPGQPAPAPVKTRTRHHGCGFQRVRVRVFTNPRGNCLNIYYIQYYILYYIQNIIIYNEGEWVPLVVSKMKRTVQQGGPPCCIENEKNSTTRRWAPPCCGENRNNDTTRRCTRTPPCCVEKRRTALRGGGYLLTAPFFFAFGPLSVSCCRLGL